MIPWQARLRFAAMSLGRGLTVMMGMLLGLALAVIAGSVIPANPGWREPESGVQIFLYSNGVHTGIVVPTVSAAKDWRTMVPASDLTDPRYAGDHLIFSWGERIFYLDTPTWSDLNLTTAARALAGSGRTLLHVDHLRGVTPDADMRPVMISMAQYAALVRLLEADFALDTQGRTQAIKGYFQADAFYEGRGRYSLLRTCNVWTGEKLQAIGVRTGQWTPVAQGLMWWFKNPAE